MDGLRLPRREATSSSSTQRNRDASLFPRHARMCQSERCNPSRNRRESNSGRRKRTEYIAYLHKDAKSDYGVSFPDFQGCVTAGSTLEEARQMAVEALAFHIAGMREDGESLPPPSTLDNLHGDPAMKGAVAFL